MITALPPALRASLPPELRGLRRDQVRLLVVGLNRETVTHARFDEIGRFLAAGDLLVLNSSRTLPAAVPALGEHTEAVLRELGYDDSQMAELRRAGAP